MRSLTLKKKEIVSISDIILIVNNMSKLKVRNARPYLEDGELHNEKIKEIFVNDDGSVFLILSDIDEPVMLQKLIMRK